MGLRRIKLESARLARLCVAVLKLFYSEEHRRSGFRRLNLAGRAHRVTLPQSVRLKPASGALLCARADAFERLLHLTIAG